MDDFINCALSGLTPNDDEYDDVGGPADDKDLADIPVGWTEIRLRRRVPNPDYGRLMQVKDAMVAQAIGQVPEEQRAASLEFVRVQIDVMFAAREAQVPQFLVDEAVVFVASPDREADAAGLTAAQAALFGELDVEWIMPLGTPQDAPESVEAAPEGEGTADGDSDDSDAQAAS